MYGWGHCRGMGTLDYYGLLAQANLQDCSPRDSACVSNNVAKQAAVEDLWASKYQTTGAPDDVKLTFAPQTQHEVDEFYSASDPFNSGNVVDTRGIMSIATGGKTAPYVPPAPTPIVTAKTPAKTADGKTVTRSARDSFMESGDFSSAWRLPDSGSFVSSVPWWGWLAGAGVAVFALKGAR